LERFEGVLHYYLASPQECYYLVVMAGGLIGADEQWQGQNFESLEITG
jgi:hypothetical protein